MAQAGADDKEADGKDKGHDAVCLGAGQEKPLPCKAEDDNKYGTVPWG